MLERKKNKKSFQDLDRKTASHMGSYVNLSGSSRGRAADLRQEFRALPGIPGGRRRQGGEEAKTTAQILTKSHGEQITLHY
jgi:hypothetical protein